MQLSISKLTTILVILLIAVTVITTAAGIFVVRSDYQLLEDRHTTEARDAVNNAALAIHNQVEFYQGIVQLISSKPEVANLLDFGDTTEMTDWSSELRQLLPGTLGTALASPTGEVHGDVMRQRVGPACVVDIKNLSKGTAIEYPPLHTDVAGMEHFNIITQVTSPDGEKTGAVFVSFHLDVLKEVLLNLSADGDHFELFDGRGHLHLSTSAVNPVTSIPAYKVRVPETSWQLVLYRAQPKSSNVIARLVSVDAAILVLVSLAVVYMIRRTMSAFSSDLSRVHSALQSVLDGSYRPGSQPTSIKETGALLPQIEQLALRLQETNHELRQQSLSDPLTNVFNRRYFDLMLAHLHEQSRRQPASVLVIIDLNDFKLVNDRKGHQFGDLVLQHTAKFLCDRVRTTDLVARLGGDEFAVILNSMAPEMLDHWLSVTARGYDAYVRQPPELRDAECQISIGVSLIDAAVYESPQDALHAADQAMYGAKQQSTEKSSRYKVANELSPAPLTGTSGTR
ncbi:MAG: GGDEF domain-containing protein [Gammaproteobacteria bacterium]|nr:GGDEF domain-containing protein [Gammaproteobacteria bacterium]